MPRLAVAAGTTLVIAASLFIYFTVSLHSGNTDMKTETARLSQ